MRLRFQEAPALIALLLFLLTGPALGGGPVLVVSLNETITPASDDLVGAAIEEAEAGDYQALLVILDTPGGGLAETMKIVELMERTELPVLSYVYPEGAKAWSAGTMILISSDLAAMSPYTLIGSAQPVQISAQGIEPINDTKTRNALVAFIEEKARRHGRNATAAREFILSNLNLNAEDAKRYRVVEYVSSSLQDLLRQADGATAKNVTLSTAEAELRYFQPPPNLLLLKILSDPMLAGLLMLVGLYALIFGISNPGLGAEVFGVIALSLGLIGMGFDVNLGALFLILLGMGLILAELHSHSFGILAVAGLICVIAGSILFVPTSYPKWYLPADYQRSMIVAFILPSLILGGVLAFAVYKVARIRFTPPATGRIMGEEAEALDRLAPRGYVQFQGEYWMAESEEPIEKGERVVIVDKVGSVLKVRRPR